MVRAGTRGNARRSGSRAAARPDPRQTPGVLTDVEGVRVGHWTDEVHRTGVTVVLLPEGTVASGGVRGGAPATREFDLLAPERTVDRLDAVVLSGGSAFGLAAADGVVDWLAEAGVGFPTSAGPVPIVVAMSLYDLLEGDGSVRPGPAEGRAAAAAAQPGPVAVGQVGAGPGATTAKHRGYAEREPGGIVTATVRHGDLVVAALLAVNAFGHVDRDGAARVIVEPPSDRPLGVERTNTTLGVVVTNARLDKVGCLLAAHGAQDGYARALMPAHTRADGDAVVAAATGQVEAAVDTVRSMAVLATQDALRSLPR